VTGAKTKTILAIGGRIGDMDLTAGPLPAEHILNGHRGVLLTLTPGESRHARAAYPRDRSNAARAVCIEVMHRHFRDQGVILMPTVPLSSRPKILVTSQPTGS
jgi:hypothetical protein